MTEYHNRENRQFSIVLTPNSTGSTIQGFGYSSLVQYPISSPTCTLVLQSNNRLQPNSEEKGPSRSVIYWNGWRGSRSKL